MGKPAVEIIPIALFEDFFLPPDRHFNCAANDHSRLLGSMGERFPRISTNRIGFVQHEKLPVGVIEANDTVGYRFDLADLHQFV